MSDKRGPVVATDHIAGGEKRHHHGPAPYQVEMDGHTHWLEAERYALLAADPQRRLSVYDRERYERLALIHGVLGLGFPDLFMTGKAGFAVKDG